MIKQTKKLHLTKYLLTIKIYRIMERVEVKTNKFEYTMTFENGMMSMTSTDPNFNFENQKIESEEAAIERFKMMLKLRGEEIIDWYEWSETLILDEDQIRKSLEDFIYDLDLRPEWCENLDIMNSYSGDYLLITLYGSHTIGLNYEDEFDDYIKADFGWGRADMEYALQIMDNRDEILALAQKMFN